MQSIVQQKFSKFRVPCRAQHRTCPLKRSTSARRRLGITAESNSGRPLKKCANSNFDLPMKGLAANIYVVLNQSYISGMLGVSASNGKALKINGLRPFAADLRCSYAQLPSANGARFGRRD